MKKVIDISLVIILIVGLIYVIISGKAAIFIDVLKSRNDKFEYTNEFEINKYKLDKADYYYNQLSENQKKIYSAIAKGVSNLDKNIIVSRYDITSVEEATQDVKEVINYFLCDHPEVFYMTYNYASSITSSALGSVLKLELNYSVENRKELDKKIEELDNIIIPIIENIKEKSNYEKELIIHDYIAKNVKYYTGYTDETNIDNKYHTFYTALVEKEAVCDGISKAFQILLNKAGIESILITGKVDETAHAWNMVNIDDLWFHTDVTSDKYIKNSSGDTIEPVHTYFNVSTNFIKENRIIDNEEILPIASNDNYTYYKKNNSYIASSDNFESKIKAICEIQKNRNIIEFATEYTINVPERLLRQLYNINFNNLKELGKNVSINYYNEQNVYIVQKK